MDRKYLPDRAYDLFDVLAHWLADEAEKPDNVAPQSTSRVTAASRFLRRFWRKLGGRD